MSGGIDFGGLDLTGSVDYDGVTFEAREASGNTLGNPNPVERSVQSSLLDGSFVVTDSYANREASFQVWIRASDSVALAHGEELLFERCARMVEFGWTPPDGWGARTVYEAFTSNLEHQFDDLLEMTQLVRSYRLRIVAHPFGFSEDEVVDVATDFVGTPDTVPISDGSSAAGWTSPDGAVTSSGGVLQVPSIVTGGPLAQLGGDYRSHSANTTFTMAATNFTSTRFLSADLDLAGCFALGFFVYADGVRLRMVAKDALPSGLTRYTWVTNDSSVTTLRFELLGNSSTEIGAGAPTVTGRIDNVKRSNVGALISTTGRQALRTISITGSARSMASLAVEHPTAGLGEVLLYTSPLLGQSYNPALRQWLTSSGSAPDAAPDSVSGSTSTGAHVFNVDAAAIPDGPHLLIVRANAVTPPVDIAATVSSVVGANVLDSVVLPATTVTTGGMDYYVLGMVTLPLTRVPEQSTSQLRISISGPSELVIDELWTFCLSKDSSLTRVDCGAGTPSVGTVHNRMFLDAPSIANGGRPGIFVGTEPDRSDAFQPVLSAEEHWAQHPATPPELLAFVVTPGAAYASLTERHRPAHHTFASQ